MCHVVLVFHLDPFLSSCAAASVLVNAGLRLSTQETPLFQQLGHELMQRTANGVEGYLPKGLIHRTGGRASNKGALRPASSTSSFIFPWASTETNGVQSLQKPSAEPPEATLNHYLYNKQVFPGHQLAFSRLQLLAHSSV